MKLITATSNLIAASLMASSQPNALTVLWFVTACMWFEQTASAQTVYPADCAARPKESPMICRSRSWNQKGMYSSRDRAFW